MAKKTRAEIEARRGITRDESGNIVLSKVDIKARIERLKQKIEDCDTRKASALNQISELTTLLKTTKN